ncbi:MAG: hypothetical protein C0467_10730 [Planctomycetaceae bacterium]|nr:hypothetical protein [Planctomycetaceae bacterium]
MPLPYVRPKVAELVFRLYDRPLHPELFDVLLCRTVKRDGYTLTVWLTQAGHALGWTDGRVHIEEVTATADMELPETGRRLAHPFQGSRTGRCTFAGGVRYQVSSQLEVLQPEQFAHVHEELALEGARKGLAFHCKTENRLGLSPLGVVIATAIPSGLNVTAFHTFPDEFALIKTQSLIEWM